MPVINKTTSLKSNVEIESVFNNGLSFSKGVIKILFLEKNSKVLKVGFSVPKKLIPLAVNRNLIKRRMKESYRALDSSFLSETFGLFFVVYKSNVVVQSKEIRRCLNFLASKGFH